MKNLQHFTTSDFLSLMGHLGLVAMTICIILLNNLGDPDLEKAMRTAESLSNQLIAGGVRVNSQDTSSMRGPASFVQDSITASSPYKGVFGEAGEISQDPWGQAYHYRFFESRHNQQVYLAVWSDGPDKKQDTKVQHVDQFSDRRTTKAEITFVGDDLGVVRLVR